MYYRYNTKQRGDADPMFARQTTFFIKYFTLKGFAKMFIYYHVCLNCTAIVLNGYN